eukprot:jgi/Botrbrau1/6902/Bobra.67_3s0021.1
MARVFGCTWLPGFWLQFCFRSADCMANYRVAGLCSFHKHTLFSSI